MKGDDVKVTITGAGQKIETTIREMHEANRKLGLVLKPRKKKGRKLIGTLGGKPVYEDRTLGPNDIQRGGGMMADRKLLATYEVRVKVNTKNLSDDQKRIIAERAAKVMTQAIEDQIVEGDDQYMDCKPGQIIIKDWKFLDLKPGPDAQRKLFSETGGEQPTE